MNILKFLSKKEAVIYCRCSRKSRKEHIRQKYICENFADKKRYKIVNEFVETITGNTVLNDRNILLDCITYCIKNKIKTIIISEVDRFSRNVQTAKDALEMVKPFKIRFIFVNEMLDSSKSSDISKILRNVEVIGLIVAGKLLSKTVEKLEGKMVIKKPKSKCEKIIQK